MPRPWRATSSAAAVATVADGYLAHLDTRQVIEWFDLGGSLPLGDTMSGQEVLDTRSRCRGSSTSCTLPALRLTRRRRSSPRVWTSCSKGSTRMKRLSRSDERGYHATDTPVRKPTREPVAPQDPPMPTAPGSKKKYYN